MVSTELFGASLAGAARAKDAASIVAVARAAKSGAFAGHAGPELSVACAEACLQVRHAARAWGERARAHAIRGPAPNNARPRGRRRPATSAPRATA
jgi:hypothetical protein